MPEITTLLHLMWVFALLSILAVGGGVAVLPEMKHMVTDVFHWVTPFQFLEIYSLGQIAPGPNMTMVVVIGLKVAGLLGAIVVLFAFFTPSCLLAYGVGRLWRRYDGNPWRTAIQRGLAPVTVGLMFAGIHSLAENAITGHIAATMAGIVALILLIAGNARVRVNPALLILAGGVVGYLLLRPYP